jgi:glycosyl transferase, family 25
MFDLFVLNLQHRIDRRTNFHFQRLHAHHSIQHEFVDAVDGRNIQLEDLIHHGLAVADLKYYTPGALGCALSHRALWQRCIAENRSMIICEDDAILRSDFKTVLPQLIDRLPIDWDFVLLGYNFDSATSLEMFPGVVMHSLFSAFAGKLPDERDIAAFVAVKTMPTLLGLHHAFGTCAYTISPKGAKRLLEICFPLSNRSIYIPSLRRTIVSFGLDSLLNTFYTELQAFCLVPPLAISPNDRQNSDIS